MENASQALIIAGTILIALIILSIGVYLVSNYRQVGESYEQTKEITEITKFNANFTKFEGREDIMAQEIITLKKFAKNYDEKNGTTTTVDYPEKAKYTDDTEQEEKDAEFIKEYTPDEDGKMQYFKLKEYKDKNNDGKIDYIKFVRN